MRTLSFIFSFLIFLSLSAQEVSPFIHVDQFGYFPDATKVAVLSDPQTGYNAGMSYNPPTQLELRNASTDAVESTVNTNAWNGGNTHSQSGDKGWWADFSSFNTPGTYYLYDATSDERSAVFVIGDNVYDDVLKAAGRMYFYNRCGFAKNAPYAETGWTDGMSFNNPLQDANCRYVYDQGNVALEKDLSGGWFDAGDYNKYITFTSSVIHNLLSAYEENPENFSDDWNIPESGNGFPRCIR